MSFHLFIRNVSCASCSACRKDFLSGKRVRPKEIGFCRLPHLKWKLGYEIFTVWLLRELLPIFGPDGWPLRG